MDDEQRMVRVISKCQRCGKRDEFQVPEAGLQARAKGVHLREAFPDLPEERIQQLAKHVCPKCQGMAAA